LVYVGSAQSEEHDQTLDAVLVGPVAIGRSTFVFKAPAPDAKKIPEKDLMGVTIILLTCHYKEKEFIRVGYYVNNYCEDEEFNKKFKDEDGKLTKNPPLSKIKRNIAGSKPRVAHVKLLVQKKQKLNSWVFIQVTRFDIPWDNEQQKIAMDEHSGLGDGSNFQMVQDENSRESNIMMQE